jgi:hypothetical protein
MKGPYRAILRLQRVTHQPGQARGILFNHGIQVPNVGIEGSYSLTDNLCHLQSHQLCVSVLQTLVTSPSLDSSCCNQQP